MMRMQGSGRAFSRRGLLRATTAGTLGAVAGVHGARSGRAAAATAGRALPRWYDDAKFGIFVHWNAASIPAYAPLTSLSELKGGAPDARPPKWRQRQAWRLLPYAEMYQNTMAVPGSETARFHAARYGGRPYDAFVERFRDESIPGWDPDGWAGLFARSGAGYVVLATKTEDGFLLWPSAHRNPKKPGWQPARDVVGELARAVRGCGLRFGVYYCGGMDWTFGGVPITDDEEFIAALPTGRDYHAYSDAHWRELITRYRPSVLWNDYGFIPGKDVKGLLETYYRQVPEGVVNDRFDIGGQGSGRTPADFVTLEYSDAAGPADRKWEVCRGIGTSFGYNRLESDRTYLSETRLVQMLARTVSDGGNLLLNVGPTGSGEIPPEQERRLLAMGRWLETDGEAVYGSRRWKRTSGFTTEGLHVRYTTGNGSVYAIVLGTPRAAAVDLDVRLTPGADVWTVAGNERLTWEATPHGTRIRLPRRPPEAPAMSLRMRPAAAVAPVT